MVFPRYGLAVSTATGAFLWFIGFPIWTAVAVAILTFLKMGGLQLCRLVYKTLPKDLWLLGKLRVIMTDLNIGVKENRYYSDYFHETVEKYPNKVAIIFEDRKMTFKELNEMSNRIANLLRTSTDLGHGDTMAIMMENCPEYVAVSLALFKIGAVGAYINHNLRGDALAHCIRIANSSVVFFSSTLADAVSDVLPNLDPSLSEMLYCVGGDCSLPQAKILETEIVNSSPNNPPPVSGKSTEDRACYIYTSGTTGLPKACHIKHYRLHTIQNYVGLCSGVKHDDVVYVTLPLYHTNGGVIGLGQMVSKGCTVVIRKKFSATNFWSDCIKYKCTVCVYIGEVCRYILAQPKKAVDTQHCVRVMMGNGLRAQIWPEFTKRFQIPQIAEFYGSTEGNVGMINPFNKVGACGRLLILFPFLNSAALVKVDPDTGEYVRNSSGFCVKADVNEPGALIGKIRQKILVSHFSGYNDSKASSKKLLTDVFSPGDKYFLTGDILRMDEEGFMYFCDRTGDTFRWKGENVSTTEVESVMAKILQLRDVVVYGVEVPGSEGRAGMAAIVGSQDSVDLSGLPQQLFLSLPPYAVPLFVRLIPSVDLTGTFKLKKVKLRKESYDISLPDPFFMLDASRKVYVPLTEELHQQLLDGTLRI